VSEPFDLVVVGRPTVDVVFTGLPSWPALGEDLETTGLGLSAGTSFNTPAAANRLGLRVAYVATVGNGPWSRLILDEWREEGLPTDFLEVADRPLPAVSVAMNLHGDRGFVSHWGGDEAVEQAMRARAADVLSSIDARHLHQYVDEWVELETIARDRGMTVSLDAWGGHTWSVDRPLDDVLANADVLFANEAEARAMTGAPTAEAALERLATRCPCVAIRRGAAGAIGAAGSEVRVAGADAVEVVDTTGAGDAFNAGFLFGWLGGASLEASLAMGTVCGTASVGDFGGYRGVPREDELRRIAAERGIEVPPPRGAGEATDP
jgi:sugar/nucleoside kinase (ribokinase family)